MSNRLEPNRESAFQFAGMRITLTDALKMIVALIAVIAAWYGMSAKVDNLTARVDNDEKQQNIYQRADVQAIRDAALMTEIQSMREAFNQRLERIEAKLDR